MKERIENLNKKIDELQVKMAEDAEIVDAKKDANKEQVEEEISKAKQSLNTLKANIASKNDELKGKAASELKRVQDGLDEAKGKIQEKREAVDRDLLEAYINENIDYAAGCIEFAFRAIEEAKLAALEAIEAQIEFEEKYND